LIFVLDLGASVCSSGWRYLGASLGFNMARRFLLPSLIQEPLIMSTHRSLAVLLCFFSLLAIGTARTNGEDAIDFNKAREIRLRIVSGKPVTAEERAYFERAKAERQKQGNGPGKGQGAKRQPLLNSKPPEGLKPLSDMTADEKYKGEDGGLYGGGKNEPPAEHLAAAMKLAESIRPLDAGGKESADGKIALVSIGMSNTTQEFSAFVRNAKSDGEKSARVALIDGAQGGMEAQAWSEMDRPWVTLEERLKQANVSHAQVQVVWMKQARRSPASLGEYPQHTQEMNGHMVVILQKLKERFPNLKIVYLSSRIYAGYARSNLNPEPYAYEGAFAIRHLIQDQIGGLPALNHDAEKGKVNSPLLLWGPYLWADGEQGRAQDDLIWKPEDFSQDGTHPSDTGRQKVAEQLLRFFKNDPTTKNWFLAK
jgi:hypothetical protein